jgi:hypothetical protein
MNQKTSALCALAESMSVKYGMNFVIASLEDEFQQVLSEAATRLTYLEHHQNYHMTKMNNFRQEIWNLIFAMHKMANTLKETPSQDPNYIVPKGHQPEDYEGFQEED